MILPVPHSARPSPQVYLRPNIIAVLILVLGIVIGLSLTIGTQNPFWILGFAIVSGILSMSPKIAQQWEKAIVLRLGKYVGQRGP